MLDLTVARPLGLVTLDVLAVLLAYHLPARWALPLLGASAAVLVSTLVGPAVLLPRVPGAHEDVLRDVSVLAVAAVVAGALRCRATYILRLQVAQRDSARRWRVSA